MIFNILSTLKRLVKSIALLPAILACLFGVFAILLTQLPDPAISDTSLRFLVITDTDSIKTILSFVIGGIFTLTIFSYTMVMNVLNRNINNYSPRLIPLILSERHHQLILGVTSGTLIYCLILAIVVTSEAQIEFPILGASIAIFFTIICVLLFIYFIHMVSQSIDVNYILNKSYLNTKANVTKLLDIKNHLRLTEYDSFETDHQIKIKTCGYFNGIRIHELSTLAKRNKLKIRIIPKLGSFCLEDEVLVEVNTTVNSNLERKIINCLSVDHTEPLDIYTAGIKHLVEVAVKASSPAINDPGTSLTCIDYLSQIFIHALKVPEFNSVYEDKELRLKVSFFSLSEVFLFSFKEMIQYMKNDPILITKLDNALMLINKNDPQDRLYYPLIKVRAILTQ